MTATTLSPVQHGKPAPTRSQPRPFGLVRHSLALARRSLIKTVRTPEQLLDVTLQPIIFVVLFVFLLGGAIAGDTHQYLQFLLPAILVQTVVFASVATGVSLNTDLKKGVFDRFRSLPIGRSAPLIGSVLGDLIRYVVATLSLTVCGLVLGFELVNGIVPALAAVVMTIGFAFCLSWAFVLLGMVLREPGAVQGVAFLTMFPLTFGTGMMAPVDTLPGWLQSWVQVNPVAHAMEAARGLMIGGPVATHVVWVAAWGLGLLAVFAPLAVRAYRRRT